MQNFPSRCIRKEKMLNKALKKIRNILQVQRDDSEKGGEGEATQMSVGTAALPGSFGFGRECRHGRDSAVGRAALAQ